MVSLLKAVANKNELADSISNNITNDLDTKNLSQNTNKIESSINDININSRIDKAIDDASKKYNIDENLIRSIIKVESNFNPNVVSSAGAKGLMQLMPQNCKALGVTDPFDIEQNIDAGTRHIKEYIDKYNGNIEMGLMAYNGGPTRMAKRGVTSPEHIYKMPKETQNYVPKVMKYYRG
ncbi:lytic transglycosylase domain-containing protein [Romboutsia weinsteinii]|uniref:Lytic transglycosylase domain-containing protein n=2 Tax=Romboutsia weinsteinii TaxID=2020949 RepID=A0A255ILU0_9FIRM|nr:lytic transglycosylase domain-containing protein [Romboutsia weinsteinii]